MVIRERCIGNNDIFRLENFFEASSAIISALLVSEQQGKYKFWKIRHAFLAKELKKQILSGNSENPEIWKEGLATYCIRLIEDCAADGNTSDYVQDVLQKLFIGNRKDRAGEDFTAIIKDIPSKEDREVVFLALKNAYPDNPHYCSHLARFYAYNNKNRDKAMMYADEAIQLSERAGIQDPLLHHIKGMCLRAIAYDIIAEHQRDKLNGKKIDPDQYELVIYHYVPLAEKEFTLSRSISQKQNKVDGHGYVAHIQLLIRAIDYGIVISDKSKSEFLSSNAEPFVDWLDLAESLLEDITAMNHDNDDGGKLEDCENGLQELYENYEVILQNLRNQLTKSKNPGRTRRQIVRTYIRSNQNYNKDQGIINNILTLMEDNIENEPDNEKNFFLWFQAARYSSETLEAGLNKLQRWKPRSSTTDAVYYLYILMVFRALEGYSDAAIEANNLIKECKGKGKSNITVYEWYGKGFGLHKLISRNSLNGENKNEKLQLVSGFFTEYLHDGSGTITILDRLQVFFSPTQAKLTSADLNKRVAFYLGFSYDGLRADSYSVRIVSQEPRSNELADGLLDNNDKKPTKHQSDTEVNKRQKGIVVDLKHPPHYVMGWVENELGKRFFFHKSNEDVKIFTQLKIDTPVSFLLKKNDQGILAYNLQIIED